MDIEVHPVQIITIPRVHPVCPKVVTLRAYEVYEKVFGKQEAMITGSCHGGFGASEIIAFLYAHTFPREEWRERMLEALAGMKGF